MVEHKIKIDNKTTPFYEYDKKLIISEEDFNAFLKVKFADTDIFSSYFTHLRNAGYLTNETEFLIDNQKFYDVNVLYIFLKEIHDLRATKLILALKKIGIKIEDYIWNFIIDEVFNQRTNYDDFTLLKYNDAFQTFAKTQKEGFGYKYFEYDYLYAEDYLEQLAKIREKHKLSADFGVLKEGLSSLNLLLERYCFNQYGTNTARICAGLFYAVIKEKPFVSHNEEIAIIMVTSLAKCLNCLLERKDDTDQTYDERLDLLFSSSDLTYATALIEGNEALTEEALLDKLEQVFSRKSLSLDAFEKAKLLNDIRQKASLDNIYRYVIYFTEHYRGYQGYYEYFRGKNIGCYKIHYSGRYQNFRFSYAKSFGLKNTLVFEADAKAYMEAPHDLVMRLDSMQSVYDEIKERSIKDIMKKYLNALRKDLDPYYDIEKLQIYFDLKWELEADPDYEW